MPRLTPDQRDTSIEQEAETKVLPACADEALSLSVGSMGQSQKTCSRAEQQSTALTTHAVEID